MEIVINGKRRKLAIRTNRYYYDCVARKVTIYASRFVLVELVEMCTFMRLVI